MRDSLFYRGTDKVYSSPDRYGLAYQSVFIPVGHDDRLHGWFFPARERARGTVVHCHGNAGNISGHFEQIRWLPAMGWNVFTFDYRGYGRSSGHTTRAGTIDDAHAAIDYVASRDDVDTESIVLLGSSLGGAVGTVVAAQRTDVRGLVLDSAFSHYRREVEWVCRRSLYLWPLAPLVSRMLFSNRFNPIDAIADVAPRPVLIIHGTSDIVVDAAMANELYRAARPPKELWLVENLGHTAIFFERADEARARVGGFFDACVNHRDV